MIYHLFCWLNPHFRPNRRCTSLVHEFQTVAVELIWTIHGFLDGQLLMNSILFQYFLNSHISPRCFQYPIFITMQKPFNPIAKTTISSSFFHVLHPVFGTPDLAGSGRIRSKHQRLKVAPAHKGCSWEAGHCAGKNMVFPYGKAGWMVV